MKEIEAKAAKIRQLRQKAKTKKTPEQLVFDFFKESEDLWRFINKNDKYEGRSEMQIDTLIGAASMRLQQQINQYLDSYATVNIHLNADANAISGVTIYWGNAYRIANQCDETLYIGVEELLLCDN